MRKRVVFKQDYCPNEILVIILADVYQGNYPGSPYTAKHPDNLSVSLNTLEAHSGCSLDRANSPFRPMSNIGLFYALITKIYSITYLELPSAVIALSN
jgi:hypothetical protein